MVLLLYVSMVLVSTIQLADCIICYSCTNVTDESVCTGNTTTCGTRQVCYKSTRLVNNAELTTLGCKNNDECSIGIVGRSLYRRRSHACMECCSTDFCNAQVCKQTSACVDDEATDCARLNSLFNICKDIPHAKTICPKFCNLCDVVDGEWSKWTDWSHCDVSCNNGTETRTRSCTNPQPEHGGQDCVGSKQELQTCYTATVCPVNGGWATWTNWGICSVSCETGIQRRQRTCTNPKPAFYGDHCFGANADSRLCTKSPCADGGWSSWSSWGQCSKTCGVGMRSQSRLCNNPRPSHSGKYCVGDSLRVDTCSTKQYCKYSDCSEIKSHELYAQDGIYDVMLWKSHRAIKVYCDMTTDGGGWTIFQNRFDGSVDFYRNYSQYVHGFGDLNSEFWLGLDYIQEMTSQHVNILRIDLMESNGTKAYETFRPFSLSLPNYVLHVGNTTFSKNIDLGSSYRFSPYHNGQAFTTYDHDVDHRSSNCATEYHGAWWYNKCYYANLNGQYLTPATVNDQGMNYQSFIVSTSLKQSRMAFRRN